MPQIVLLKLKAASERNLIHSVLCTLQPHFNSHFSVTQPAGLKMLMINVYI